MPTGIYKRTKQHRKALSDSIKKSRTSKVRLKISLATKKAMKRLEVQEKIRKSRGGKRSLENYCLECNKKIDYRSKKCKNHAQKNKFVSEETRNKIRLNNLKRFKDPRNHPSWVNGSSFIRYPKEFYRIRKKILIRDNYICQECFNIGRDIHHIDYNKKNNKSSNLITLCSCCHAKTTVIKKDKRNYWKIYFSNKVNNYLHMQN